MKVTYLLFGIFCVISQLGIGLISFCCGRWKEGLIGCLFGIANGLIYLWPK